MRLLGEAAAPGSALECREWYPLRPGSRCVRHASLRFLEQSHDSDTRHGCMVSALVGVDRVNVGRPRLGLWPPVSRQSVNSGVSGLAEGWPAARSNRVRSVMAGHSTPTHCSTDGPRKPYVKALQRGAGSTRPCVDSSRPTGGKGVFVPGKRFAIADPRIGKAGPAARTPYCGAYEKCAIFELECCQCSPGRTQESTKAPTKGPMSVGVDVGQGE